MVLTVLLYNVAFGSRKAFADKKRIANILRVMKKSGADVVVLLEAARRWYLGRVLDLGAEIKAADRATCDSAFVPALDLGLNGAQHCRNEKVALLARRRIRRQEQGILLLARNGWRFGSIHEGDDPRTEGVESFHPTPSWLYGAFGGAAGRDQEARPCVVCRLSHRDLKDPVYLSACHLPTLSGERSKEVKPPSLTDQQKLFKAYLKSRAANADELGTHLRSFYLRNVIGQMRIVASARQDRSQPIQIFAGDVNFDCQGKDTRSRRQLRVLRNWGPNLVAPPTKLVEDDGGRFRPREAVDAIVSNAKLKHIELADLGLEFTDLISTSDHLPVVAVVGSVSAQMNR